MALCGWASFTWASDYGQFYLIDIGDAAFAAPVEITEAVLESGYIALATGLVVYTADCLQQRIDIAIHDAEPEPSPAETISDKPWTRTHRVALSFPSRSFQLSSPSHPHPLPGGPFFLLYSETVTARINWLEGEAGRDDSMPIEPDVIEIAIWPG